MLARYREDPGDAKLVVGARATDNSSEPVGKKDSKWARAKRMGESRRARIKDRSQVSS